MQLDKWYIYKLCSERGWSQNELARQIGVSKGTISRVVTGKRKAGRKVLAGLLRSFPDKNLNDFLLKKEVSCMIY